MNKILQLFKDLPQTFYARGFYQDLILNRTGIGLGFLVIATLITALAVGLVTLPAARPIVKEATEIFAQLPNIVLENGAITVKAETPLRYTLLSDDPDETMTILIDPQMAATDAEALRKKMADEKIVFIAGKDSGVIYDRAQDNVTIQPYDKTKTMTITHEDWMRFGNTLQSMVLPFSFVGLTGLIFLSHLVTAFLGGVLIMILAPLFKVRTPLSASMRLAAAAKIPVAVVFTVATPYPPLQAALWFGFVAFGLLGVRRMGADMSKG